MKRFVTKPCVLFLLLFLLTIPAAVLFLRYSGSLLLVCGEETFGTIFSSLRNADILPPFPVSVPVALLFSFLLSELYRQHKLPAIALSALLWLVLFLITAVLCRVNSIRFLDILLSLLDGFRNGLADAL